MDSEYPEPLSRLRRRAFRKKIHKSNAARYRTQPVTFAEIQEVDEEIVDEENRDEPMTSSAGSKSESNLEAKFEEFKRQRDRDSCEISSTADGSVIVASVVPHAHAQAPSSLVRNRDRFVSEDGIRSDERIRHVVSSNPEAKNGEAAAVAAAAGSPEGRPGGSSS